MNKKTGFNTKNNGLLMNTLEQELELFQRHIAILKLVMVYEPVGIRNLSSITGFPMHKVRYSLSALEDCGLVKATVKGAVTTKKLERALPHLREGINSTITILMDIRENYEMSFNHTLKSVDCGVGVESRNKRLQRQQKHNVRMVK